MLNLINQPNILIGAAALGYWLYKKFRGADIQSVFIHDMATNHLPHIYHVLTQMATVLQIPTETPPPIKFISSKDFKDKEG